MKSITAGVTLAGVIFAFAVLFYVGAKRGFRMTGLRVHDSTLAYR
jgi:hypothetical protein